MKLVLFGASGNIGRRVAREALGRGHEVTAVVRDPATFQSDDARLQVTRGDVTDPASVAQVARGADAILSAVGNTRGVPGPEPLPIFAKAAHALIAGAKEAGVHRLVVVGGAGTLEVAPGVQAVDSPGFPDAYKGDALGQRAALEVWRSAESDGLDWTYVSPAAEIGDGARTGRYRLGHEQMLLDADGHSRISYEDYAIGFLDALESDQHSRRRITVAY